MGYIRTDGMKVYGAPLPKADQPVTWYLMYDFGLKPGESVDIHWPFVSNPYTKDTLYLRDEVESPKYGGRKLMTMVLILENPYETIVWIKGITNECWFEAPGMTIDIQGGGGCTVCREIRFNDETLFADFPTQTPEIPESSCYELDGLDLIIKELPAREPICIYELDGHTVYSSSLSGHCDRITLPHTGLYIVRVGDQFNKIMIY